MQIEEQEICLSELGYKYTDEEYEVWDEEKQKWSSIRSSCYMQMGGFPKPEHAYEPITAITYYIDSVYHVFGCGDFSTTHNNIQYIKCDDELDLINKFLKVWTANIPDIVTGWSSNIFDFPYIINRMKRLFFEDDVINSLSPWKQIFEREYYNNSGRKFKEYKIVGVAMLDYFDLYIQMRIWANKPKSPSMKLNYVAYIELGEKKVDYSEYENLHTLYKLNYQKFIEYNIKDVSLVIGLEEKLKVIKLFLSLAYSSKTNYEDPFFQVRMWDSIIYNHLKKKGIQIPLKRESVAHKEFVGGYVKDPKLGESKWLVSLDFDGMYPHAIMNYSISPETLIDSKDYDDEMKQFLIDNVRNINVEGLRNHLVDTSMLKRKNITLTPNRQFFRLDKQGFLPELMEIMYKDRARYKKASIEAKKKLEVVTDASEKLELEHLEIMNNLFQQAKKVCLNSAYGVTGNKYFRFSDVRISEAITTSSQLSTRFIEEKINEKLNNILKTKGKDFVVAADTDSCYITLEDFIEPGITGKTYDVKKVIAQMDKFCNDIIQPFIDSSLLELSNYLNAYAQKFKMKRESLCDKGIWVAKKRYILNIYDKEGVVYSSPKVDVTGLEGVRSTTPEACRVKINEAYNIILNKDKKTLIEFVDTFREEFKKLPIQDISITISANGLEDYSNKESIYIKRTPIHVKGSLIFNHYLKQMNLMNQYEEIKEGEKVRYLYLIEPNPLHSSVISFVSNLPKEFDLNKYLDYNKMYDKTFIKPLESILNTIGWKLEEESTLERFFG